MLKKERKKEYNLKYVPFYLPHMLQCKDHEILHHKVDKEGVHIYLTQQELLFPDGLMN